MKYLICVTIGSLLFAVYEMADLTYAFIVDNSYLKLNISIFQIVIASFIGALLVLPYPKLYHDIPGNNIYIKSLAYFLPMQLLLSILMGITNILSIHNLFGFFVTIALSLIFARTNEIYNHRMLINKNKY